MPRHAQLHPSEHGDLKVRTEHAQELGDSIMFAPTYPHEFRNVQAHYPIAFLPERDGQIRRPVTLFGLQEGENLFVPAQGGWDAPYVPMAMRRGPFSIGRQPDDRGGALEVHVDLDHPRVTQDGGDAVFLPDGEQSPYLKEVGRLLGELAAAEGALPSFIALLAEHDLLEPFSVDVTLNNGETGRLQGFLTVSEERLQALDGAALARLHGAGALTAIFMVVASVVQFRGLIERKNALAGG